VRTPKLISTAEAACRLQVAQLTVRRWVHKGRLRGQMVGRSIVIEEAAVAELDKEGSR